MPADGSRRQYVASSGNVATLNTVSLAFFVCGVYRLVFPTRSFLLKCQKMNEF